MRFCTGFDFRQLHEKGRRDAALCHVIRLHQHFVNNCDRLLRVTQDDVDGVIWVDDDPIMRTAPLGVLSGAVVGVVTALRLG